MMVIIKDEKVSSMYWSLGRTTELFPGKDGVIRTVSVKTKKNVTKKDEMKRSVTFSYFTNQ